MREIFYHRAYKRQPTLTEFVIFNFLAAHFSTNEIAKMFQVSSLKIRYFGRKHNIRFTGRQFNMLKKFYEASGPLGLAPDAIVRDLLHDMIFVNRIDFDVAAKDKRVMAYGRKFKIISDKHRHIQIRENAAIACYVAPYLNFN